ncbi:unnamed protein product [Acanthosepion pharaonis]|uniref:Uncharacterized protein n=1 Tax=Acanthosepion pharaonis TaxID=158019 RepID=A0A812AZB6_ACAPH|nr:unnamed protein product [Sepia pharaonis]
MDVAARTKDTTLKAFFKLCRQDEFARTLLYPDVPSYYVWIKKNTWARRKCETNVGGYPGVKKDATLGRVFTVPPSRQECFYLRLLLEDDSQWDATMAEGALLKLPSALPHLFTTILQMCEPCDPKSLWDKYKDFLSEDILREAQLMCPTMALTFNHEIYNRALIIIENLFVEMGGGSLAAIGLPTPDRVASSSLSPEIGRETSYSVEEINAYVTTNEPKLLVDQMAAYDAVLASTRQDAGSIFFLDAPGEREKRS